MYDDNGMIDKIALFTDGGTWQAAVKYSSVGNCEYMWLKDPDQRPMAILLVLNIITMPGEEKDVRQWGDGVFPLL